ncbi:MerR family transcriptional regulator [Desulfurivibrio sp. D14AmB]|uniref:MerR family transcriptional regulator n=1 Tax=Desulfurivibrio sp. D14AmB TaxID=3374370 RepID=UPI00376F0099
MAIGNQEAIYPISVAAKLLSVHPRTLRIYEEEGLVKPSRKGNKRYYSNDDIAWITCLRDLIHQKGISIPGIKMLLELTPCWKIKKCPPEVRDQCSAFIDQSTPCWQAASSLCSQEFRQCRQCPVYIKAMGEVMKG